MMNSCELTAVITAAANSIACKLTDEELLVLSSVFIQLGDTLATISATKALCAKKEEVTAC